MKWVLHTFLEIQICTHKVQELYTCTYVCVYITCAVKLCVYKTVSLVVLECGAPHSLPCTNNHISLSLDVLLSHPLSRNVYTYMICVPPLVQLHACMYGSNWYLCFEVPGEVGDSGGMVQNLLVEPTNQRQESSLQQLTTSDSKTILEGSGALVIACHTTVAIH